MLDKITDLTYTERAWTIAKMQTNFSLNGEDVNTIGYDFTKIKTLGLEMANRFGQKNALDKQGYLDNDKLKLYYVVPGKYKGIEANYIVDNTGKSVACEIATGKEAGELIFDKNFEKQLEKNPQALAEVLNVKGLGNHTNVMTKFVPKSIEDLTESIAKSNGKGDRSSLVKSKEEVKTQLGVKDDEIDHEEAIRKGYESQSPEEAKDTEKSIEEAASAAGITKEKLEQFLENNGYKLDDLIGLKKVQDVHGLSEYTGESYPSSSPVIMLKVKGETVGEDRGLVVNDEMSKVLSEPSDKVNQAAQEIVPEHSCSEVVENVNEVIKTSPVKTPNQLELERLEQEKEAILKELQEKQSEYETKKAEMESINVEDNPSQEELKQYSECQQEMQLIGDDMGALNAELANIVEKQESIKKQEGINKESNMDDDEYADNDPMKKYTEGRTRENPNFNA